jgi:choline transporter-like protein 2/4/5
MYPQVQVFGEFSYGNLFMVYLLLGMLWTLQFFNGIGVMTISGAVGSWYWSGSTGENKYGHWPVLRSFFTTMRFHMGTIAFGSLLVAIIQLIRYIAAYIQARAARLKKDNRMIKVIFCIVHCFLACVETCVKFISRNSYIMCALYGDNFCVSTKLAFFALASNLAQVATVTFLGDIIKRLGQFMIASMAGLSCWMYLDNTPAYRFGGSKELSSFIWPVSLAMVLAWYIGGEVLAVYDVCVDTILLSYCQDRKLSKHRMGHKQNASESFRGFMMKNRRRGDSVDDPNSPPEGEVEGIAI